MALLDDRGFEGLTMRALAERMDMKAASLYNHVRDKDELLVLVADAICAEVPKSQPARAWRGQLEHLGAAVRRTILAHRDAARVLAATPPVGPNRLRLIEDVLAAFLRAGLSPADVADAAIAFNAYVVGFVLDETTGRPTTARELKRSRDDMRRWFKTLPQDAYPTVVALADVLIDAPPDRPFALGLGALLDGIERRAETRRRRT